MKKLYSAIFFLLAALGAKAQFSITYSSHSLATGTMNYWFLDSAGISAGAAGANVTWDFDTRTIHNDSAYMEVIDVPTASQMASFPGTNLIMYTSNNDTTFYRQTTDSLIVEGLNAPQTGKFVFTNPAYLLKYPYSYADAPISDVISTSSASGTNDTDIDGYGTLKVGGLSFTAIRLYTKTVINTTISGFPATITVSNYTWFEQTRRQPLMRVTTTKFATALGSQTSRMGFVNSLITSIKESKELVSDLIVYPNPSKGESKLSVTVSKNENIDLRIVNSIGQSVMEKNLGILAAGIHTVDINTADLAKGVYFLEVRSNGQSKTEKLIVE